MTVVIPEWVYDRMVQKFGPEEARRSIEQLGVRVDRNSEETETTRILKEATDGLG